MNKLRDVKVLHLEPTDVCQAACPLCLRELDKDFDKHRQHHLTVEQIRKQYSEDFIKNLDKVFMCGIYGDPAAGKYTLDLYRYFRKINPTIVLGMHSNGALQNTLWWHELGRIMNQSQDYVVFSIDGNEDTNHIYRVNVNWTKLKNNIEAFVSAGGQAHWDMLVYQHNEHQGDLCEQMARDMGFTWFRAKVSKRPCTGSLQYPVNWAVPNIVSTQINCHALQERSMYIDAQCRISPCCWLGNTQTNFITDFDLLQREWSGPSPNVTCVKTCGTINQRSNFSDQWQREVELC
jgi:sulfatase maturation enzyme AslB (radical SAM superfamily)